MSRMTFTRGLKIIISVITDYLMLRVSAAHISLNVLSLASVFVVVKNLISVHMHHINVVI